MKRIIPLLPLLAAMLAASCSVARRCEAPRLDLPAEIVAGRNDSLTVADIAWWDFYGDSLLRGIIERTLDNNREMQAAAARVERMRRLYRIAQANRLPELSGSLLADHETNDYADEASSRDPQFDIKLGLSWELDLWGNLRWAKRKGGAEYLATVGDERAMRMTLVAEAAAAYYRLIALDNELAIVRRTLATRREGVYQARLRFEGGLTSETVFQQAKVEYAATAALIPDLERRIETTENALALLMGDYADRKVARTPMRTETTMADSLPVGIPSVLLRRRPDVQAAEQRLQAAMAAAGMAYADRFPASSSASREASKTTIWQGLFRSPFSYVAGTLAAPVFGFGRKRAAYEAALAAYDEARALYEQKVLEVFKEAEDAVIAYRSARRAAGAEGRPARRRPQIRRTGPPAIPRRQHQLHRRARRPAPLLRRRDGLEQRPARRTARAGRPLQGARRRLAYGAGSRLTGPARQRRTIACRQACDRQKPIAAQPPTHGRPQTGDPIKRSRDVPRGTSLSGAAPKAAQRAPPVHAITCGRSSCSRRSPPRRVPPRCGAAGCTWPYGPNATSSRS